MILITGTNLTVADLPNNDMVEYQIENEKMNIKLKTVAKSPTCFQIYISEDKRVTYTITDDIISKIIYFKDDDDLLDKLENGATSQERDIFDDTPVEPEPVSAPDFSTIKKEVEPPKAEVEEEKPKGKVRANLEKKDEVEEVKSETPESLSLSDMEEANTDLPDDMLQIPNISDDVDSLKELLNTKDKIISQKDGMIKELKQTIEDSYKTQELQLIEVEDMWTKKANELQRVVDELQASKGGLDLDSDMQNFLKFYNYAERNKAIAKEGFTNIEMQNIGTLSSIYTVFASGSGESYYSMIKQVKKYIDKRPNCIILDFSNDIYLSSLLKVNGKHGNTLDLLKEDRNPLSLLQDIEGTKYIPTISYNDITLLSIDWSKMLRKIDDMASGVPVILLFGNINNFNVRYTVSKLASIMPFYVFVKCSPIILTALYRDIAFIPKERVNILAIEYIDVVKNILAEMAKYNNVTAFSSDVEWKKLGML